MGWWEGVKQAILGANIVYVPKLSSFIYFLFQSDPAKFKPFVWVMGVTPKVVLSPPKHLLINESMNFPLIISYVQLHHQPL